MSVTLKAPDMQQGPPRHGQRMDLNILPTFDPRDPLLLSPRRQGFITGLPSEVGTDSPLHVTVLPYLPPRGKKFIISTLRISANEEITRVTTSMETLTDWFKERETLYLAYQTKHQTDVPFVTFYFQAGSHTFPMSAGPQVVTRLENINSCYEDGNLPQHQEKDNLKQLELSAYLCDLIAQHPEDGVAILAFADGFTCDLPALLLLPLCPQQIRYLVSIHDTAKAKG